MTAEALLGHLAKLGIAVVVDGGRVQLQGRGPRPPESLLEEIRAHKDEIVAYLDLTEWPEVSRACVRELGRPEARLYPFVGESVMTPGGAGRLLEVHPERVSIELDAERHQPRTFLPSEVTPPGQPPRQPWKAERIH